LMSMLKDWTSQAKALDTARCKSSPGLGQSHVAVRPAFAA
jgi:hypothetical protein